MKSMAMKKFTFVVVLGLFAIVLLSSAMQVFALPPVDVSGKICSVSGPSGKDIKVGCDAYASTYNICDAECMKQRINDETLHNNFFSVYSQATAAPVAATQTSNSSDLEAVAKYFPQTNANAALVFVAQKKGK
jgi:hypothetical protein